jgi:hypothetical protein
MNTVARGRWRTTARDRSGSSRSSCCPPAARRGWPRTAHARERWAAHAAAHRRAASASTGASVSALDDRLPWESMAPLLRPVVPDVYRMAARSPGLRRTVCELVGVPRGGGEQAALAMLAQRQHMAHLVLAGDRLDPGMRRRAAHHQPRLGVADEIVEFRRLVGGVQRQVHIAGPQRRQIQQQGFGRFFDLHGHPRAGRQASEASRLARRALARSMSPQV